MIEQQLRVLLLDDEEALRRPLQQYLENNFGYRVDAAATGEEALRFMEVTEGRYDVALLDEVLYPGLDGIEVMQEIKARYPDIECIVFTAWGPQSRQRALQAGAFRYLERPFDVLELALLVRSAAQQVRLRTISRTILSERDLDKVLEEINVAVCSLALAEETAIVLVDRATSRLRVHVRTSPKDLQWRRHFRGMELSREIIGTGQAVRVPDTTLDERVNPKVIQSGVRSFVGVPIPGEQENLGVLYVYSQKPGWFDEWGTVAVVQTLAGQAGLAIANAQVFRQIHAHARYMEALVQAGQGLAKTVLLEEQLALIWNFVREQLKVSTFFVALYDKQEDVLHFPLACDEGQQIKIPDRHLGDDRAQWGITGYVVKTGQELHWLTQEMAKEQCDAQGIEGILVGEPCQSCFYLPLEIGSEVIGAISIQSYDRYAFTSDLLAACRALGSQLAVALENARLFEAESRRRQEAETLQEAVLALTTTLDQQQVFERILSELQKVVPYDSASVQLLKGDRLEIIGGHGFPNLSDILGVSFPLDGDNPNRVVTQQRAPFIVSDAQAEYENFSQEPHIQANIRGWLGVPMLVGDRLIGMIALDKHQPRFYTEEHVQLAQAFATQAALAIENARLYREAQEGQAYLRSLYQASGSITSLQDPDQVLRDIVEEACDAVRAWRANVVLVDDEGRPRRLARVGFDRHLDADISIRPTGISAEVMRSSQPVLIEDVQAQNKRVNPGMITDGVGAAACFPMRLREEPIGVMWVHYREPRHFSEAEAEALRLYASQAAIAYDNARRMRELEHLRRAAEKLAKVVSVQEVLGQIARSAREVLGATSAVIWSYDAARRTFIPDELVADGIQPELIEKFREDKPRPGGTAETVVQRQYLAVNDVDDPEYAYIGSTARGLRAAIGVKAFQGIALQVRDETLGVLYVNYEQRRGFSDEDRVTLETFAHYAALTLKKARLLEQVSKAHDTAKVVAEVSVLEDLWSTLDSIARGTQDALGCDAVTLYTYDESRDEFGFPPAIVGVRNMEEVLKFSLVARESVVRRILALDKMYVAPDAPSDPLVCGAFVKREEVKSSVGIPLKVGDRKVGVMFVNYRSRHRFTGDELTDIELFANQAAVAIRNAQLYQELQRRISTLQALYEAGQAITGTVGLQETLDQIVQQAMSLIRGQLEAGCFSHLALVEGNILHFAAACTPEILAGLREKVGDIDLEHSPRIGITGRAAKTGQLQNVGDVNADPDYIRFEPHIQSELAVPIKVGEQVIGVINIEHTDRNAFIMSEQRALESLAAQAAIAIRNARQSELQQAVYEASKAISTGIAVERRELLNRILEQAAVRIRWPRRPKAVLGLIQLYDEAANELHLESVYPSEEFPRLVARLGERRSLDQEKASGSRIGVNGRAVLERKVQRVSDVRVDADYVELHPGTLSELDVPLQVGDRILGVLGLESDRLAAFDEIDERVLQSLADMAAIVIENAHQYEELKRTKGLVGARTALAWMGMTSSVWRHTLDKHALTIREQVQLLRKDLERVPHESGIQVGGRLSVVERLANQILEKPITPPLSTEEGVFSVPVNELIRERTRQLWQSEPHRSVALQLDLALDDQATIRASPEWLRRALDILVDNAVDAMADSLVRQITITTQRTDGYTKITVSDAGRGIVEDILPKLFIEPIKKPKGAKGLGMGLLMAQAIIQTYGGEIGVASTGPMGTTVFIRLPLEI